MSAGMNAATGRALSGADHIRQSVRDILTTRIGTRVKRRSYGGLATDLVDQPGNAATRLRLMSASVHAITRWEPRIRISSIDLQVDFDGSTTVTLDAVRTDGPRSGQPISLAVSL